MYGSTRISRLLRLLSLLPLPAEGTVVSVQQSPCEPPDEDATVPPEEDSTVPPEERALRVGEGKSRVSAVDVAGLARLVMGRVNVC